MMNASRIKSKPEIENAQSVRWRVNMLKTPPRKQQKAMRPVRIEFPLQQKETQERHSLNQSKSGERTKQTPENQ
jgi:hypothetical protein